MRGNFPIFVAYLKNRIESFQDNFVLEQDTNATTFKHRKTTPIKFHLSPIIIFKTLLKPEKKCLKRKS